MIDFWDERFLAALDGSVVLLFAWSIYSGNNKKQPHLIPAMKLQMIGLLLMGIDSLAKYLSLSHATIPPKLHAAFGLPGAVLLVIGGILILKKHYQNRNTGRGNSLPQPRLP